MALQRVALRAPGAVAGPARQPHWGRRRARSRRGAALYPHHSPANWENLDLIKMGTLHFEKPDLDKFPCIRLAYEALKKGGSSPIVLNVANDIVVAAFLDGFIPFTQISTLIEDAISQHDWISKPNLEAISELSGWTSQFIQEQITTYA